MAFKVIILFSAVVIQTITCQCLRAPVPIPVPEITVANLGSELPLAFPVYACETITGPGVPGLNFGLSISELSASNGGGLRVNSASPMASTGVTVETDKMVIEGPLAVTGQLPFLGAVSLEGPLPACGTGTVAYECTSPQVGMVSEIEQAPIPAYPGPLPGYPGAYVPYPSGPYPSGPYPSGPYQSVPIASAYTAGRPIARAL
ncbi:chorion class CB protein PC404-like [Bicyclus anynana]|uniref:Chorion class CB protein PC404-like n=1 Tax=Bicyclus anynana TaxID=110368 RepID=A0A6J1NME2_BICAN|nr:chorion class CB protein PC404-like [Bicyclus anynana]